MQRTEFDARAFATAAARYGLAGAQPPDPVEDENWALALATLAEEKVLGIACAAADDGWLPLTDDQYADLAGRQRSAMAWCLGLERRLLQVADAFDSASVDFIVLKGPALAHVVYPEASWRTFSDLDLLVRTSQWRVAVGILEDRFGWGRRLPEPRRGFDERFGKAAVFTTESGQQIDLHRNLAQGPFGVWIDPEELFERTVTFAIGGSLLRRLDVTSMLVHACIHAALGDVTPRLLQRRDILETTTSRIDWDELQTVVDTWRLGSVVVQAAHLASVLDGGATRRRIGSMRVGRGEERALAAYSADRRTRADLTIATLRAVPSLTDQARYLRDLVFPGRAFTRARGARRWRTTLSWLMGQR
jgi:hypothetical protein